jgi:integrase
MTTAKKPRATSAVPKKDPATGRWAFVCDVVGTDGRRSQTRRKGFRTREEAQAALDSVRTSVRQRTYIAPERVTLAAFAEAWLEETSVTLEAS